MKQFRFLYCTAFCIEGDTFNSFMWTVSCCNDLISGPEFNCLANPFCRMRFSGLINCSLLLSAKRCAADPPNISIAELKTSRGWNLITELLLASYLEGGKTECFVGWHTLSFLWDDAIYLCGRGGSGWLRIGTAVEAEKLQHGRENVSNAKEWSFCSTGGISSGFNAAGSIILKVAWYGPLKLTAKNLV